MSIDVAIMMGSKSDLGVMKPAAKVLEDLGLRVAVRVLSAHRTPVETAAFVKDAVAGGCKVFICAAGGAAHLAGVAAAHTVLPVLGVPIESASLKGLDSLLSTVQMPSGIPVGTLGIGKPGAINAALLAAAVLAASRPDLRAKLHAYRREQARTILDTTLP